MRYLLIIFSSFIFLYSNVYAKNHYLAIVDAGSSGSRIYLYQYNKDANTTQTVKLLAQKKIHPGISSFAANPQGLNAYMRPLLTFAKKQLQGLTSENQVKFSLMSTAGMRLLSPLEQERIYQQITKTVKENTHFKIQTIGTIPGQKEALYGWIAVNYAKHSLIPQKTTGVLDMGGASTEIAFETNGKSKSKQIVQLQLGQNNFPVYSVSYLGLGQNQIRNQFMNNGHCFPVNYPLPNGERADGYYKKCVKQIKPMLKSIQNVKKIKHLSRKDMPFVAVSWFHDLLKSQIFDSPKGFTPKQLEKKGRTFCSKNWSDLQQQYPNDSQLYSTCFNLAYYYALLKKAYHFDKKDFFNTEHDVDWALGVAVYQAYQTISDAEKK